MVTVVNPRPPFSISTLEFLKGDTLFFYILPKEARDYIPGRPVPGNNGYRGTDRIFEWRFLSTAVAGNLNQIFKSYQILSNLYSTNIYALFIIFLTF